MTHKRSHKGGNHELRQFLLERDGNNCFYCEREMVYYHTTGGPIPPYFQTIDCLNPYSKGGELHPDNTVLACHECNSHRRDTPWKIFKESLKA